MPSRDKDTQTINNYIYGGRGGIGGVGGVQGHCGGGGTGEGPILQYEIRAEHVNIENRYEDETTADRIIETITCVPAWYDAANTPEKCMDGTRVKVVRDLIEWLKAPPDPSKRILMLSGSAGSGKSTVTKSVASELAEVNHILAASFFFSRDYLARKEIAGLATTLAYQLAAFDSHFKRLLGKLLERNRNILSKKPQEQFQTLVVELLAKLPPNTTAWVICLDALDECGGEDDGGLVFLSWLSANISQIPAHVRFLLTGRPTIPSLVRFPTLKDLMQCIILDDIDPAIVSSDIRLYVERSLDGNLWFPPNAWKAKDPDIDEITDRAGGLFIYAVTSVRYIVAGLQHTDPQKSIDYLLRDRTVLTDCPNTKLHRLYHCIVYQAITEPHPKDARARDWRDRAVSVLSTIFQLVEPLGPTSLASLLDMDVNHLRKTLHPFGAVIHVPDGSDGGIRIIHLSFREFMMSAIEETRPELLCGTAAQKQSLASNVLQVMHRELYFNICNLPTSYLRNTELPDLESWLDQHVSVQLRYSCRFWGDHVWATSCSAEIVQEVKTFLFQNFLFWLEVLSLLGRVSSASGTLSKLIGWAPLDESIVRFARDGKLFISSFADAIIQSAPHIYLSALALAPTQSEISRRFRPSFPRLVSVQRGTMRKWPATTTILKTDDVVSCVSFSPDRKYIVSCSQNAYVISLWDAETGELLDKPFQGHIGGINCVAFSRDSKYVASASNDRTVRLWDISSGWQVGQPFKGHIDSVMCVAFSPDGTRIVSGSRDKTLYIWDVRTQRPIGKPLRGHKNWVLAVSFSDIHIASGSRDKTIRLWDPETRLAVGGPLDGHTGSVSSVIFSQDGKRLVSGAYDHSVCIWDVATGTGVGTPFIHPDQVTCTSFSPCESYIAASCICDIHVWDLKSGAQVGRPISGHGGKINSVMFSSDGLRIVSGAIDKTLRIWHMDSLGVVQDLSEGPMEAAHSVAFSPDGKHIACALGHVVHLWDAGNGQPICTPFKGHTEDIISVAFSPDGGRIGSASKDKTVGIWDTGSGKRLFKLKYRGNTDTALPITFTPDGTCITIGTRGSSKSLDRECWDALNGQPLVDGGKIISESASKALQLWKVADRIIQSASNGVQSVALCPSGQYIAIGGQDRKIRLRDSESKKLKATFINHTDWVTSVVFSPNSTIIASGSRDGTVRLWNTEGGPLINSPLEGHTHWVESVAFSCDGRHVVSGSRDCTVRVWDVQSLLGEPHNSSHSKQDRDNPLIKSLDKGAPPSLHWKVLDGWVSCRPSELLLWLPHWHREGLWSPYNTLVIGREQTLLGYEDFVYGEEWERCYQPLSSAT